MSTFIYLHLMCMLISILQVNKEWQRERQIKWSTASCRQLWTYLTDWLCCPQKSPSELRGLIPIIYLTFPSSCYLCIQSCSRWAKPPPPQPPDKHIQLYNVVTINTFHLFTSAKLILLTRWVWRTLCPSGQEAVWINWPHNRGAKITDLPGQRAIP